MEKAYADIDLEKLDEDLDIDADGMMEEFSELLMKELTGLDLDSENLDANRNADHTKTDPSTDELPFEQCSGNDCASVEEITDSENAGDDNNEAEEPIENNIIEADSSEEVARVIAASVLR